MWYASVIQHVELVGHYDDVVRWVQFWAESVVEVVEDLGQHDEGV